MLYTNLSIQKTVMKDPKKLMQRMVILCILIGILAFSVGILAFALKEYIIGTAMLFVTALQIYNYKKWKRTA